MKTLTEKQERVLAIVREGVMAGKSPTIREICQATDRNPCTVYRHLEALERKGRVRRGAGWRCWELAEAGAADVRRALVNLAAACACYAELPPGIEDALNNLFDLGFDPQAAAAAERTASA